MARHSSAACRQRRIFASLSSLSSAIRYVRFQPTNVGDNQRKPNFVPTSEHLRQIRTVGAALIVHVAAVRRELVRPIERLGVLAALVDEPGDLIPARAAALGAFDPKTSSLPTSLEQRRSHELVKLARKLRWIGMDEEADRVQAMLHQGSCAECVVTSSDTD